MKEPWMTKGIVIGIIFLFLAGMFVPCSQSQQNNNHNNSFAKNKQSDSIIQTGKIICYTFGAMHGSKKSVTLPQSDIDKILRVFRELKDQMMFHPVDEHTQQLKEEFIELLTNYKLIPKSISPNQYHLLLNPPWLSKIRKDSRLVPIESCSTSTDINTAAALFCSIAGEGVGFLFPFIMLPRPRLFMTWSALDGSTIVGKLLSIGGFAAGGAQFGVSLGFWGIGLAFAFPYGNVYGFIGYSLFATVTGQYIERYPPDYPPIILGVEPADGAVNVPVTLDKLQFSIEDPNGDLMRYEVTTNPDIGSGSGTLKTAGTYIIPVHGLTDLTEYEWTIKVSDDVQTTEETFRFTTEAIAPIISDPVPADGERDVPMDVSELQFTLNDYQGDAMEYTVQTSPDIGSAHVVGVHDDTFSVPVHGLTFGVTYRWFVNVTDGVHWARKIFSFETGYPSQFDPFEFGWQYRKQVIINHTLVTENLENFPILINTVDSDLLKTQDDGGDILFMDGAGIAKKQYHEIEFFDKTNGALIVWVNTPSISATQDTIFYMYYDNPTCINQQNPEKTWNSHYKAVWHMNNNPTGIIYDSTQNKNDGSTYGAMHTSDVVDGKIGKCLQFDGINDYISVPDSSSLKPKDVTLNAWFCPQQQNLPEGNFIAKHCYDYWGNAAGHTYALCMRPGHLLAGGLETSTFDQALYMGSSSFNINEWLYLSLTFDDSTSTGRFYVNGILQDTKVVDSSALWYNNPWDFIIGGCRWGGGSSHDINTFYNCKLDDIKILNTPLSSNWISTEYTNQNDQSNFLSIGPEEGA